MKTRAWGGWLVLVLLCGRGWSDPAQPEGSVYDLASSWTDQQGRAVQLADLKGRPRVVAMFFSQCTFACPRITADLKRLEAGLSESQRARVGFVLVSFDVRRDDPAALRDFAQRMDLPGERWTLLHGGEDEVRELAAVLGVRYRPEGDGFAHANIITLLDAEGRLVAQREGLDSSLEGLGARLQALTERTNSASAP